MKKLTLDLDALHVDSFEPAPAVRSLRGTVKGRESDTMEMWCREPNGFTDFDFSCMAASCIYSCITCGGSCDGSCATCDSCDSCYTCNATCDCTIDCTVGC